MSDLQPSSIFSAKHAGIALVALCTIATRNSHAEELVISDRLLDALYGGDEAFSLPGTPVACKRNGVLHDPRVRYKKGYSEDTHGTRCVFHFTNFRLVPIDVKYSEVRKNAVPERIEARSFIYKNCEAPYKLNDTVQVTTREGQSITQSTSISAGKNVQWNSSVTFTIYFVQLGGGEQKTVTYSAEQREQKQTDFSRDVSVTQQINDILLETGVEREVRFLKTLSTDYVEYSGFAEANADVAFQLVPILGGRSSPVWPLGTLKELTKSKASPVIELKGKLWNVRGEQIRREDYSMKLPSGACEYGGTK